MRGLNRQRPDYRILTLALPGLVLLAGWTFPAEAKKPKAPKHELCLEAVVPRGGETALDFSSGWALTLHLRTDESRLLGIGKEEYPPTLPGLDVTGWLVFEDPDGCPSFVPDLEVAVYEEVHCNEVPSQDYPDCRPPDLADLLNLQYACPDDAPDRDTWLAQFVDVPPWPADETWAEFRPGVSKPDSVPLAEREPRPEVWTNHTTEWRLWEVGPTLGSMDDDTRYGAWVRLPGLVVLADHGPSLLTETLDPNLPPYPLSMPTNPTNSSFFDPPFPRKARNIAGLFNSLGYTLLADVTAPVGEGEITVTTQMIVPHGLVTPVVLKDTNTTIPFVDDYGNSCEPGSSAYRLDGGPLTCFEGSLLAVDQVINATLVTLRIFVVHGTAPDVIWDVNGDYVLDIEDVEAMGYRPLTGEEVVTLYQHHQLECGYAYDFDGDGDPGDCALGARAGGITGVPR